MRNILEYPVTYKEAQDYLDKQLADEVSAGNVELKCGDMTPSIIQWIKDKLLKQQLVDAWSGEITD